jgi:hypothetical protein
MMFGGPSDSPAAPFLLRQLLLTEARSTVHLRQFATKESDDGRKRQKVEGVPVSTISGASIDSTTVAPSQTVSPRNLRQVPWQ